MSLFKLLSCTETSGQWFSTDYHRFVVNLCAKKNNTLTKLFVADYLELLRFVHTRCRTTIQHIQCEHSQLIRCVRLQCGAMLCSSRTCGI